MFFVIPRILRWVLQSSCGKKTMKKYSNVITYNRRSKWKYNFLLHFAFFETVKVFMRILKGMYLILISILDRTNANEHKLRSISVRISFIRIWTCFTNGSDLITVGEGETFIHIFKNKNKYKTRMNTNFASMLYDSKEMKGRERQGGELKRGIRN